MQATIERPGEITFEQYLRTSFEHDADYVDGRVVARTRPTENHGMMQGYLVEVLRGIAKHIDGLKVIPEQRILVEGRCSRVADVCVTTHKAVEGYAVKPPFLCIEILSPDDTVKALKDVVRDYLAFGVEYVWVIDPEDYTGWIYNGKLIEIVEDGIFRAGEIEVNVKADYMRDR